MTIAQLIETAAGKFGEHVKTVIFSPMPSGSISTTVSSWSFTVRASPLMPDCWPIASLMTRSA